MQEEDCRVPRSASLLSAAWNYSMEAGFRLEALDEPQSISHVDNREIFHGRMNVF
jgi:hypothetical protein